MKNQTQKTQKNTKKENPKRKVTTTTSVGSLNLSRKKTNNKITLKNIEKAIRQRNLVDSTRKFSPLRIPRGAVIVDTTNMNKKQMFRQIFKVVEGELLLKYGRNYKRG